MNANILFSLLKSLENALLKRWQCLGCLPTETGTQIMARDNMQSLSVKVCCRIGSFQIFLYVHE